MYLERILTILETVSGAGKSAALTVSEIAEATGVPKPSLYRQINDLVDAGLLEPRKDRRYAIGARTRRLSGQFLSQDEAKQLAIPLMKRAAKDFGAAFFMARLTGASVEIVHAEVPSNGVSYLHPGIGARPLHACSCGKAIAAFSEDQSLNKALSGRLRAYTDHTKTELNDIKAEFRTIQDRGYAECLEELEQGVCSVAAPVRLADQPVLYSLGATGTLRVFTPSFRDALGGTLVKLCQDMSDLLDAHHESEMDRVG